MVGYIAQKKSRILEVTYLPGEAIPKDAVPPDLEGRLIKQGFIARAGEESSHKPQTVKVPVNTKNGSLMLEMAQEDVAEAIIILQLNAEEAVKAVNSVDKEEILILIDAIDSRKTVKTAIREKVEETKEAGDI